MTSVRILITTAFILLLCIAGPGLVSAQDERTAIAKGQRVLDDLQRDLDGHPRVAMRKTEEPPTIDGVLDDAVWEGAPAIDDFRQVEPVEGGTPSERTVVRLLYDANFLYLAIRCYDREPENIVSTQMIRDASLGSDDRIEMVFDTFFDRRNAYYFRINPAGAKGDALVENSGNFNDDWDGIWYGKASTDAKGWIAEIAIPYQTISFDPGSSRWGFNIRRFIRRRNESIQWASPLRNTGLLEIGESGVLEAISDLEQGIGLDVKPFVSATWRRDHRSDRENTILDPGLDIFYKVTPRLTAAFTVNTDFAEAEVDERRVNLGRVPLFFPEKRDFFLQDAGIFAFGGINSDPLPFFSRRIGRGADGRPVDIIAGAKLTGRVDDLNIGLLDVQLEAHGDVDTQNVAVGRLSLNVLEESTVGIIATSGDPRSNDSNHLVGADFNFRNSHFLGNQVLTANAWVQKTFSEELDGKDYAWGARMSLPNDRWNLSAGIAEVYKNYNPALGFTRRPGRSIREHFFRSRFRVRPGGAIRSIDFGINGFAITDVNSKLESGNLSFRLIELQTEEDDGFDVSYQINGEYLDSPFEIRDGVVIPEGHYGFSRFNFGFFTSSGRPLSFRADFGIGGFYDGTRFEADARIEWRPSKHFFLSAEYEHNDIRLPAGDFITRVVRVRANVYFTPDLSWTNFVQYDNVSDELGLNSRLRWIFEPEREFFFVVNQGFLIDDGVESTSTEISAKLGWTFRF